VRTLVDGAARARRRASSAASCARALGTRRARATSGHDGEQPAVLAVRGAGDGKHSSPNSPSRRPHRPGKEAAARTGGQARPRVRRAGGVPSPSLRSARPR